MTREQLIDAAARRAYGRRTMLGILDDIHFGEQCRANPDPRTHRDWMSPKRTLKLAFSRAPTCMAKFRREFHRLSAQLT